MVITTIVNIPELKPFLQWALLFFGVQDMQVDVIRYLQQLKEKVNHVLDLNLLQINYNETKLIESKRSDRYSTFNFRILKVSQCWCYFYSENATTQQLAIIIIDVFRSYR